MTCAHIADRLEQITHRLLGDTAGMRTDRDALMAAARWLRQLRRFPRHDMRTVRLRVGQWLGGATAGDHGIETVRVIAPKTDDCVSFMYGIPIHALVGAQLGDGSLVEVTVRVIRRRPLKKNPWLFDARGRRTR